MQKHLFDLTGKKAVVTGAGRGIGKAVALGLAGCGVDVALVARSEGQLQEVATEIESMGGRAVCVACDLCDVAALPALAGDALQPRATSRAGTVKPKINRRRFVRAVAEDRERRREPTGQPPFRR